mmetsp:Transcript_35403/g.82215  ORF Transcript_35403/g.82215 Transcript_35403/m.82215 type:complete len:320 (+) Transcript_35403:522-1481(+)
MSFEHGLDDDVSRASLNRCVDGLTLSSHHAIAFSIRHHPVLQGGLRAYGQVVNPALTALQRGHVGVLETAGVSLDPRLPVLHLRVGCVPFGDHRLSLLLAAVQLPVEAIGSEAIGDAEVHSFGVPPLSREAVLHEGQAATVVFERHMAPVNGLANMSIHVQCGVGMEVDATAQALYQLVAAGNVRQYPDVQLPVVSDNQASADGATDSASHLVNVLVQRGQLLEVGVHGCQTASGGVEVEARMHSACAGDTLLERPQERAVRFADRRHPDLVAQPHTAPLPQVWLSGAALTACRIWAAPLQDLVSSQGRLARLGRAFRS